MYGENGGSKLVEPGNVSGAASANASYWLTSSGPPTDAGRSLAALQPYVPIFEPQPTCTLAKNNNYNNWMREEREERKRERGTRLGNKTREKHEDEREDTSRIRGEMTSPYQSAIRRSRFALERCASVDGARPHLPDPDKRVDCSV